jgi:2-oxoglutarate dehydrogenase complex dehydrogenase (E1) component-like enzyme
MDTRKDRTTTCLTFQLIRRNQFFKLNEAVSLRTLHTKYGQKTFSLEGESIIPALDTLIERAAEMGVEQFVMGMAHRGRLNILANIWKSTQDIFGESKVKITIKNILTVMLSII